MSIITKKLNNATISKSLIFAWAILLIIVLSILVWVTIWPTNNFDAETEISTSLEFELPDPVPIDDFVLQDEEMKVDNDSAENTITTDDLLSSGTCLADAPLLDESKQELVSQAEQPTDEPSPIVKNAPETADKGTTS